MTIKEREKTNSFALLVLSAMVAGALFTSCNSHQNKPDEMQSAADTTKPMVDTAKLRTDWEQFKTDANAKIDESRDSIESFKTRIARADKKMKVRYDARVAELERKNAELKNKLDDYKVEEQEKWDKFKMDFNSEMDKLRQEIKDSTAYNSK